MRISLIGTRGVPARYGGFETCVEEVGRRLVQRGHEITVYCREGGRGTGEYLGMRTVRRPALRRKTLETLSHTALSMLHASGRRPDVAVVFNAANAPLLPVLRLRGIPVITHVDGLEWKRAKWGPTGSAYYRRAEALAVRWSDALIADARGIQDYYRDRFGVATDYIPYGAPVLGGVGSDGVIGLGLRPRAYHLVVARFEPENHVHLAVEGYLRSDARHPLVVVGSAPYANDYTERITRLAEQNPNIRLLGGIWDQRLLDQLYGNALTYIHGHSVGGTNPSLLRAMGAAAPTSAFDVRFNREVLGSFGRYFADADDLAALCDAAEADPLAALLRGQEQVGSLDRYTWDGVAEQYEQLAARVLSESRRRRARPAWKPADLGPVVAPKTEELP